MNLIEKYRARMNDTRQRIDDITTFLAGLTKDERSIFEERAAIIEFDGGLTRAESEKRARSCIVKIGKRRPQTG